MQELIQYLEIIKLYFVVIAALGNDETNYVFENTPWNNGEMFVLVSWWCNFYVTTENPKHRGKHIYAFLGKHIEEKLICHDSYNSSWNVIIILLLLYWMNEKENAFILTGDVKATKSTLPIT